MIRVVIVDDQAIERFNMKVLFRHCSNVEVVGECDSIAVAAELINQSKPDAVFLDIEMGYSTGFDLLPMLHVETHIVFVTLHNKYALRAFEVNALDYLLKPVNLERLQTTLNRIGKRIERVLRSQGATRFTERDLILLKDKHRQELIPVDQIVAISSDGDYSHVYTFDGDAYHMLRRMKAWQERLPETTFRSVDRTLIVNIRHLKKVMRISPVRSSVTFRGVDHPLEVGRRATAALKQIMKSLGA